MLCERLGYFRVRVPERAHSDASAEIEIAAATDIPNTTSLATLKHEVEPRVRRHNELLKQLVDVLFNWRWTPARALSELDVWG